MGKIFYVMGKSSSGKDTIFRELMKDETLGLQEIVLYTTRPIRAGEKDGVDYHFVDDEVLRRFQKEEKVIELRCYNTVMGVWKYFTVDDEHMDLKRKDYLAIGTLVSYEKMRAYYGEERVLPIYVEVPDDIRLIRAIDREKKQEKPAYEENLEKTGISRRFSNAGTLEECLTEIRQFIKEKKGFTNFS